MVCDDTYRVELSGYWSETGMTFFTSDLHFGHINIIRLCNRPFETQEEMDAALLSNWNAKVGVNDTVYILGDLFFRAVTIEPILRALHGRKHLILGNHDSSWTSKVNLSDYFESVQTVKEIMLDGTPLTLCHYPMLCYPNERRGYMIYGHLHNNVATDYWPLIARRPRMLNAGVDVNGFAPATFEELLVNNRVFIEEHLAAAQDDSPACLSPEG